MNTNSVLWLTGHSGAGKTTLAKAYTQVYPGIMLDGDELRASLSSDLGFDEPSRREQARRAAAMAHLLHKQGFPVLVCLISPTQDIRDMARQTVGPSFAEIFISTSIEVCESRDPKGLYAAHSAGAISRMTGRDFGYERPRNPDMELDLGVVDLDLAVQRLHSFVGRRYFRD